MPQDCTVTKADYDAFVAFCKSRGITPVRAYYLSIQWQNRDATKKDIEKRKQQSFIRRFLPSEDDNLSPRGVKFADVVEPMTSEVALRYALYLAKRQPGESYSHFIRQWVDAYTTFKLVPIEETDTEPGKTE